MTPLFALLRKDFTRRWRSPVATVVLLVFPFMMAGMIGAISSGGGSGITDMTVFVLNNDEGLIGGFLTQGPPPSSDEVSIQLIEVGEEGFARMEKGEASAMIVLDEGFTERALRGEPAQFRLIRNPAESIKPEMVEQGLLVLSTYIDVGSKVLGEELVELLDMFEGDEMPTMLAVTRLAGRFYERIDVGGTYIFPPVITVSSVKEGADEAGEAAAGPSVFGYVLVMVAVMSVLFAAIRATSEVYEERKTGMVRRIVASPVPIGLFVGSKILFAVLFGLAVMIILLLCGGVLGWFGSDIPVLPILVHTSAFALASAGMMVLIIGMVRTEKQAGILSWILVMAMSSLGGSMMPAESMGPTMLAMARFTLNYWAVEGYLDMIVRDVDPLVVLRTSAGLAGVGVALVTAGFFLLRARVREALA